jgi:CPA2 family monovalent cation:H+ antiporter-2
VGFLLTGMVCGPYGLGLVSAVHEVEVLSEVGVVLLMFSIGMELSIGELIRLRKPVFAGGSLQVLLTVGVVGLLCYSAGDYLGQSAFLGCLAALSSTAIVLQVLQQGAQVDSPHGRVTLSVLIFQDLAIVPMMLIVPFLAGAGSLDSSEGGIHLLLAGLKTLGIIVGVFLAARTLVPLALALVVGTRSRELFLIATLGICLAVAWITSMLGLSLSLGAFLAGLIISESEYSHSALEGIVPFKDVFTSLFFTSVGMLLNLGFFFGHLLPVAGALVLLILIKALAAGGATLLLGYPLRPALITGIALCQIGEFSFVLAKEGLGYSLMTPDMYQMFLAASVMSMALTPFLLAAAPRFADLAAENPLVIKVLGAKATGIVRSDSKSEGLHDHLIIIGFGIGGQYLAKAARMAGIKYTILEMNPDTVHKFSAKGEPISHGDATQPAVLRSLGITHARVLAIVISDPTATRRTTEVARKMAPGLHIMVRTRFLSEVTALKALGASDVIPEELETAVEIFTGVLSHYLVPRADIEHFIGEVRAENYEVLRNVDIPGAPLGALQAHMPDLNVAALDVKPGSPLDGVSLRDSNLRQKAGLTVVAVRRGTATFANPGAGFTFAAHDVAYVFASHEAVCNAAPLFSAGGSA